MRFFELEPADLSSLNDADLREMVARLCEAELVRQKVQPSCVLWGGAQEAADGGLDVRITAPTKFNKADFVPREHTGFQVKKNSMSKAACKKEMLEKDNDVKPVIIDLASQKGAYIIVSGKDDCSDKMLSERRLGMSKAVENLSNKNELLFDFYGRDRLSTWLRKHPGVALWVRSRLGKPLSGWTPFGRWAATPPDQDDKFLLDDHPCVIDANSQKKEPIPIADGIKLTRDKLRNAGSTVRITGLSGVGKTRFAQALFEIDIEEDALPAANVIYADLGDDIPPTASELISYLIANDLEVFVVLDNCPPDIHRTLQKKVSASSASLSLLTIEYDISDDRPEETEVVHLEPSSEKTVSKLIQKRFPDLGPVNADKVAKFAGGNARVAIALASRVDVDETLTNFSDEDLFQRLFSQRKGITDSLLEGAEILSLVYSFNVSQSEYNDELDILATIGGLDRRTLNRSHAELLRRQLSQQRGDWRAVLPHALARRALQNITPAEINDELFKRENLRLFKSCAHRLGYLHDFEPARQLADTWVQSGGPLHDIASCDEELLTALGYIAPVFPEAVLSAIEAASNDPVFTSRNNKHFLLFVRLLRQLAYEDEHFDRAAEIILKFAETEKTDENNNSVVDQLSSLFSLHLSGTQATPQRRQAFLNRLLNSNRPKYQEISSELFRSAFNTSHWFSYKPFGFGARKRDFGWSPTTQREKLDWYRGFIELLRPKLSSNNEVSQKWAKGLLANHFRGLWSFAHCFDILEEIIREHASEENWPEMWLSIKKTISYDGKKHSPELLSRIETLERLAAPSDPYAEIEVYAFTDVWQHTEVLTDVNYAEKSKEVREKITKLGKLAVSTPGYLEKLAPRLWKKGIDALSSFGKGLAKGSVDPSATFDFLVGLMQAQCLEHVQPILFNGFIHAVHTKNPNTARQLQERVIEIPELKPHFVYLLGATPIEAWGAKKLLEMARSSELDAWQFEQIKYGQIHKTILDKELAEILLALIELKGGIFSTIEILDMRFFIDIDRDYVPSEVIRSVGRKAILELLLMHRENIGKHQWSGLDRVIAECLSSTAPENEIREIVRVLCDENKNLRPYGFDLTSITEKLIMNFPELVLNRVVTGNKKEDLLVDVLFKDRVLHYESLLNQASVDRLVKWCNGNQDRIMKVAAAVSPYSSTDKDKDKDPFDHPKKVKLSEHIKALLEVAENPIDIVEIIFKNTWPGDWSGSLANILEVRSRAFAEFLEHPSDELREFAKEKLGEIKKSVHQNREQEAERNSQHEQRFE
ncbi:ATP-binding protein [Candidatus Electrothrix laxa]